MKAKPTRRDVMLMMAASASATLFRNPLDLLFGGIADGLIQRAEAQVAGLNPRKYIYFQQPGAPPRWFYDLFLTPYASTGFVASAGLGTRFRNVNGVYDGVEYATTLRKGVNAPWMWQFNVPSASGGVRPMDDLLTHMLQIRGLDSGNNGHEGAQELNYRPLGATQSISALASDAGKAPIAAVDTFTDRYIFKSRRGLAPVRLDHGTINNQNIIQRLMDPFVSQASATFKSRRDAVAASIGRATAALDAYAASEHPGASSLSLSRKQAEDLMKTSYGDLSVVFTNLRNKYESLIKRAMLPAFDPTLQPPGLTDIVVGTAATRDNKYLTNGKIAAGDLRTMFTTATTISRLADTFALVEFAITNGLTDSMSLKTRPLTSLTVNAAGAGQTFDEHEVGIMPSLLHNTFFAFGFSACLLELIDRLKARNLFNDTVIHVGAEFDRNPKGDGTGSDHADIAQSVTFYTGAINAPVVLGNINNVNNSTTYPGTWGVGAPVTALGNQRLDLGHLASSIAVMLRVPSPITARPPIVAEQSGAIVPTIERAKQV